MKRNWIKTICLTFLLWVMVLPIAPVLAIPISDIPNPRKLNGTWVSDVANILSADTEIKLNQRISQLEARNGSEIAVVTVPDTSPLPILKPMQRHYLILGVLASVILIMEYYF